MVLYKVHRKLCILYANIALFTGGPWASVELMSSEGPGASPLWFWGLIVFVIVAVTDIIYSSMYCSCSGSLPRWTDSSWNYRHLKGFITVRSSTWCWPQHLSTPPKASSHGKEPLVAQQLGKSQAWSTDILPSLHGPTTSLLSLLNVMKKPLRPPTGKGKATGHFTEGRSVK